MVMRKKDKEFAAALASCVNTTPVLMREEYSYPYLDPMPKRKPPTNADRIRSMRDDELAEFLLKWTACDKEGFMCCPKEYKESGKCDGMCVAGRIDWLHQPAKEESL